MYVINLFNEENEIFTSENFSKGGPMIPPAFEYLNPNQLSEAISLLQKHGEEAKILAGGHSLIPAMKLRFASPNILLILAE